MREKRSSSKIDFSKGPVWKCIVAQAVPLTIAQLVQLLYNVVDRIYLGHMGDGDSLALTGVGLTFPVITLIMAFTALFGNGGVPLFAMARGRYRDVKNLFLRFCIYGVTICGPVGISGGGRCEARDFLFLVT